MIKIFKNKNLDERHLRLIRESILKMYKDDKEYTQELMDYIKQGFNEDEKLMSLLQRLGNHDKYTLNHSIAVAILSVMVGYALNLPKEELLILGKGGLLHDIGKMEVDLSILNKPARLTSDEFEIMKSHSQLGYEILKKEGYSDEVALVALNHHERLDGSGYPNGLFPGKINRNERIVAVCDIYDALTSDRVYKKGILPISAYQLMFSEMRSQLDMGYLDVLMGNIIIYPIGSRVLLSTREIATVIGFGKGSFIKPVVKVVEGKNVGEKIDLRNSRIQIIEILSSGGCDG